MSSRWFFLGAHSFNTSPAVLLSAFLLAAAWLIWVLVRYLYHNQILLSNPGGTLLTERVLQRL
jgi:hypothetical protein